MGKPKICGDCPFLDAAESKGPPTTLIEVLALNRALVAQAPVGVRVVYEMNREYHARLADEPPAEVADSRVMARTAESIVRTAAYPWGQHVSCADDPEALEAVALGWLEPGEPSPLNPGVRVFHVTAAGLAMAAESGAE